MATIGKLGIFISFDEQDAHITVSLNNCNPEFPVAVMKQSPNKVNGAKEIPAEFNSPLCMGENRSSSLQECSDLQDLTSVSAALWRTYSPLPTWRRPP